MLRYDRQTKPGLVALYDIQPGNGAGLFLQPWSPHGAFLTNDLLCSRQQCRVSELSIGTSEHQQLQTDQSTQPLQLVYK